MALITLGANSGKGKVLQVVTATKTDTFTTSSTSNVTITGLEVNITPSSTSSKIFLSASVNIAESGSGGDFNLNIFRDSTNILLGDTAGNRTRTFSDLQSASTGNTNNVAPVVLDSPSTTSQITYSIKGMVNAGTVTGYVNRSSVDSNSSDYDRCASSITVMEIAG